MLTVTEFAGFAGAGLAGAAYVPQIVHLVRARCPGGISRLAFEVWLLASLLTTARAIAIHAGVFIVLGGIQIVATAIIVFCAIRYKDTPCPSHVPRQPVANTTTGRAPQETSPVPDVRPACQVNKAKVQEPSLLDYAEARDAFSQRRDEGGSGHLVSWRAAWWSSDPQAR